MPTKETKGLVLVVDDEERTRKIIVRMLKDLGYTTIQAADGSEAIHLYSERSADIVAATLDLMMPETNGRTVLAMLSDIAPFLPIVISSGLDPAAERLQGRVPGSPGVVYLQKPYTEAALGAALERVIGETGSR